MGVTRVMTERMNMMMDPSTVSIIRSYAREHCEGNLSQAARRLIREGYVSTITRQERGEVLPFSDPPLDDE